LFEGGADVDAIGSPFGSVLTAAAFFGYTEILRLLLNGGADVNIKTGTFYGNALYAATFRVHIDCAALLVSRGAGREGMFPCAGAGAGTSTIRGAEGGDERY
jgi:ankyrin repeat protein